MTDEDHILTRVLVEQLLARLPQWDREMVILLHQLEHPVWWDGPWPPTLDQIGRYIGLKYEVPAEPLSEAAIRYREEQIFRAFRNERPLQRRSKRRKRRKS